MVSKETMCRKMDLKLKSIVLDRPSEAEIQRKEEMWRLKLPPDYRQFLKEYNGGIPEICEFEGEHSTRIYMVEFFLSMVKHEDYEKWGDYDIDVVCTQLDVRLTANEHLIGEEILPIAHIFAGDFVCLDFREDGEHPSVCVWSHEESGEFDPVTYKIADSFTEFTEKMFFSGDFQRTFP